MPEVRDDSDRRFQAAPAATMTVSAGRIVWPESGLPAAFDPAAAAMLDCFDEPLLPVELARDLVDAVGMAPQDAARAASSFIANLVGSGHLLVEGVAAAPAARFGYPPSAST